MSVEHYKKILPVITAYVEGRTIQYSAIEDDWFDYEDEQFMPAFDSTFTQWRVKPEVNKKKCRVAICETTLTSAYTTTVYNEPEAVNLSNSSQFIKWITDWIEYEI